MPTVFKSGQTHCTDISILNDGLTEGEETFIVQVVMVDGNVLSSASVIISSNSE